MNAFEFGYSVGIEKVANALAVRPPVDTQKTANMTEAVLLSLMRANPLTHAGLGAATYAPVGAALGAYRAPRGQKLRGAGRGALTGAATGAGAGAASALAMKGIGGMGGMLERGMAGGMKNNLINQLPNVSGLAGGVAGYQLAKQRPAAKQAGVVADMATTVKEKSKQLADKTNTAAKTVANKAVDAGKKMQAGLEKWRTSK